MRPPALIAIAALAWLFTRKAKGQVAVPRTEIEQLIRTMARAHGVPEHIALAFADVESDLNPNREGDLHWADNAQKFERFVTNNPVFAENAWRADRAAWHSYGLFQLLAPFYAHPKLHPRHLLDPQTNTEIALKKIANLLRHYGTADEARVAYVCGSPTNCSPEKRRQILTRFHAALAKWGGLPSA